MSDELDRLTWPLTRIGEALTEVARRRFGVTAIKVPHVDAASLNDERALHQWIEAAAAVAGLRAEPVETTYAEIQHFVQGAAPALLRLPADGEPQFVVVFARHRREATILAPDLSQRRVKWRIIQEAFRGPGEAALSDEIDQVLTQAGILAQRQPAVRAALLRQRLAGTTVQGGWLLFAPSAISVWAQVQQVHLPRNVLAFGGVHALQYGLWLLSWWMLGRSALTDQIDMGWLIGWALALLTMIPARLLVINLEGRIVVKAGVLLKQRLLAGALQLEPDEIRIQGVGQLLGRVIEAEAVETLALNGGLLALLAITELILAAFVIAAGASGSAGVWLLVGWLLITALITWRLFRQRSRWTDIRLSMTHDLVERMSGYRTRLAQEQPERWHNGEDEFLAQYLAMSRPADNSSKWLNVVISRGWLIVGLLGLAPTIIMGTASPAAIAIGVGGVLSAYAALRRLVGGLTHLTGAALAWDRIALLFQAAARRFPAGEPALAVTPPPVPDGTPVIEAHAIDFRYNTRSEPVLKQCHLQIDAGDHVLLEGPSGSGKSTLSAMLIGLRQPDTGVIRLDGFDRAALGQAGWRRRVAAAPQFHENYVLTETFAFNLLMARAWPPLPADLEEAEAICHDLGLGDLLRRMPAGLLQMVGEGGWQLSHGERSRLYVARALLQNAQIIVLDESFAALDPETLEQSLNCVLKRAPTLLVIAHT